MLTIIVAGAFVLGAVVLVHEFGHFIVAKLGGIYVKTFSIGFGKKLLRRRHGETEYVLSVLPFGGYVKFAGETEYYRDEEGGAQTIEDMDSGDEVPDSEIPRERYFTTKPKWIRAAVLFAGPFMNYVTAIVIYVGLLYFSGVMVSPTRTLGVVTEGGPAATAGLEVGDEIVAIDGEPVHHWGEVVDPFVADPGSTRALTVLRGEQTLEIALTPTVDEEQRIDIGFDAHLPPKIGRVQKNKPAWKAGIRSGAVIEAINDTLVTSFDDVRRIVNANPGEPLYFRWAQGSEVKADTIIPESAERLKPGTDNEFVTLGLIGIGPDTIRLKEGFAEALAHGFEWANLTTKKIVVLLGKLFTGQMSVKTLGGPILIAQMAGDTASWGFDSLLVFLAFFNINLCIFNLIPLMPFDGGHLAILGIEGITRRQLPRRIREWVTQAGFILVILLMLFVVTLDLTRCSGASLF
jgi:regulator of sigma E protease